MITGVWKWDFFLMHILTTDSVPKRESNMNLYNVRTSLTVFHTMTMTMILLH